MLDWIRSGVAEMPAAFRVMSWMDWTIPQMFNMRLRASHGGTEGEEERSEISVGDSGDAVFHDFIAEVE